MKDTIRRIRNLTINKLDTYETQELEDLFIQLQIDLMKAKGDAADECFRIALETASNIIKK